MTMGRGPEAKDKCREAQAMIDEIGGRFGDEEFRKLFTQGASEKLPVAVA